MTQPTVSQHHAAWIYLLAGQLGWFVCVLSAAHGCGWIGMACAAALLVYHLGTVPRPLPEARLIGVAAVVGWLWESGLTCSGLLVYPNGELWPGTAPYWMVGLWILFAVQFNVVYRWLHGRILWAVVLGALAGPLSFRAGAALGAVSFPDTRAALAALALGWSVLLPAMLSLARRWDGVALTPTRQGRDQAASDGNAA